MSDRKTKYLQFFVLCLIWSTTWGMIKIGAEETPPMVGLAIRFIIALVILFSIIFVKRRKIPLDKSSVITYLIAGIFSQTLSYYCTYWGTQFVTSGLSAILWATMPLTVGVFAHFMIPEERLNWVRVGSVCVSIFGVILILSDQKLVFNWQVLAGGFIVLLAVLLGSFPAVYIKKNQKSVDPLMLTAMSLGIAAVCHSVGALATGQWQEMSWDLKNLGAAAYLGIFGSATAFFIYYSLLRKISVIKLSFINFVTPVFAAGLGWLFLSELITFREIVGTIVILAGLFFFDFRKYLTFLQTCLTREQKS